VKALRDDELCIVREFDAPAALVFRLWEDRRHLLRWWGPEEFTAVALDWELTPGRPWSGEMASKQYGLSRFGGLIREVETNRRIVFTFRWDDDPDKYWDTVATVSFAEKDGRTVQTFHQTPLSSVAIRDSHIGGWNSMFNKQQLYGENVAIAEMKGVRI
jgi:uncharacterized protein YndB with AHSA1/START domain